MSSSATTTREDPWYRVVRCLVLLLVASLERKIARLLARMDALPEDARFDVVFERLDAECHYLERVRDRFLAWLDDPSVELPRPYDARAVAGRWRMLRSRPRRAGVRMGFARAVIARVGGAGAAGGRGLGGAGPGGRCMRDIVGCC